MQNKYSLIFQKIKNFYYMSNSFFIDIATLQLCSLEMRSSAFFKAFVETFLFVEDGGEWVKAIEAVADKDFGSLVSDLFSMLAEVVTNDVLVPNIFFELTKHAKDLFGAEVVEGKSLHCKSVEMFLLQFIVVNSPIEYKSAIKQIRQFCRDDAIIDDVLQKYLKYDSKTKLVSVQKSGLELFKNGQNLQLDALWFNTALSGSFNQNLLDKFPAVDCLRSGEAQAELNKRIKSHIYDISTLEQLAQFGHASLRLNQWEKLVGSFLKYVLIVLNAYKASPGDEEKLKKVLDGSLHRLLDEFQKKAEASHWVVAVRKKIDQFRRTHFNEVIQEKGANSKDEEIAQSIIKASAERLKKLFDCKKNKIFTKILNRRREFFQGLEITSEKLITEINQQESAVECCLTGEKIDINQKYYTLCHTHHFNVDPPHSRSTKWQKSSHSTRSSKRTAKPCSSAETSRKPRD